MQNLCPHDFFQLRYSHVKRKGNKVTHSLARHATTISEFIMWMECVPPYVASIYQVDMLVFNKYHFLSQ